MTGFPALGKLNNILLCTNFSLSVHPALNSNENCGKGVMEKRLQQLSPTQGDQGSFRLQDIKASQSSPFLEEKGKGECKKWGRGGLILGCKVNKLIND